MERQKPKKLRILLFRHVLQSTQLSSKEVAQKCKQFKWTSTMVDDLLACLKALRTKKELEGLGYDEAIAQSGHNIENLETK